MNRLQLSPQSSTHDVSPLVSHLPDWVYDSNVRPGLELPQINWYAVLGITLATAVSAAAWVGLGLMIAYIWK